MVAGAANAQWAPPYLLYLGNARDDLAAKTARGLAYWRPQWCVGQLRGSQCRTSVGLTDMDARQARLAGANTMIVGVANAGGVMDEETVRAVVAALDAGLNVASGLHQRLASHPAIVAAAQRNDRHLYDARNPPPLQVGHGQRRAGKRLLTVGTDCSVGKMYASLAFEKELRARGLAADFRATGQTGIFIAGGGVPIDAVIADFISGAAEWISPAREDGGWDIIEGQGSLFHPSYAGVSLGLLHGAQADALLLCHEPTRQHMRGLPHYPVPHLRTCLEANLAAARLTSPGVLAIGVALNTSGMDRDEAQRACESIENQLDLPCQDPVTMGMDRIADRLQSCFAG
ncbi:EBNA-1 nuclear protein [Pseudoxanthomonas dokdonensis]|uniref:EBNA-1 nuclear protein n=1 Tax=Pseudoxanthomonas dokdonensis TaxID=344882 RepID=A0A0R0CXV8_9GAMM|nr:EBNA-1 nuclear protein [Pseudoxanthomonas dokdonensis]